MSTPGEPGDPGRAGAVDADQLPQDPRRNAHQRYRKASTTRPDGPIQDSHDDASRPLRIPPRPFGRDLPFHAHTATTPRRKRRPQRVCINDRAIGVVTGEVCAGKTGALKGAGLPRPRPASKRDLPAQPRGRHARLYDPHRHQHGGAPKYQSAALARKVDERGRHPGGRDRRVAPLEPPRAGRDRMLKTTTKTGLHNDSVNRTGFN